jgi:hypothetical protein
MIVRVQLYSYRTTVGDKADSPDSTEAICFAGIQADGGRPSGLWVGCCMASRLVRMRSCRAPLLGTASRPPLDKGVVSLGT